MALTQPRPYTRGNPGASSEALLFFNEGERHGPEINHSVSGLLLHG